MQGSNILYIYGPGLWFVMAHMGKSPHRLVSLCGGPGFPALKKRRGKVSTSILPCLTPTGESPRLPV